MTTTYPVEYSQTKEHRTSTQILASSTPQDQVKMSVDAEGAAHIMSLLTDLYSNPQEAVIREYVTNALDAHVEAGQTRSVEVFSPSNLSPQFVVKDYGTGMSLDDIKYVYSAYGRSTKRRDFTQVGAFGLGCKSALTLTSQFTLVSIKNGQSVTAVVSRGEDGVGNVAITNVHDTDEPNGTRVTIPIKDIYEFSKAIREFNFNGFDSGALEIDGKPNVNFSDMENAVSWLDGNVTVTPHTDYWGGTHLHAVMGGVVYPVTATIRGNEALSDLLIKSNVYFNVPIASVDLTPSREALRYTDRTKDLLNSLVNALVNEIETKILEDLAACTSLADAISHVRYLYDSGVNVRHFASKKLLKWNDINIPSDFKVRPAEDFYTYVISYDLTKAERHGYISFLDFNNRISTVILVGKGMSGAERETYRRNYRKYLLNKEISPNHILHIFEEEPTSELLSADIVERAPSFDVVKAEAAEYTKKTRTASRGRGDVNLDYDVYTFPDDGLEPSRDRVSAKEIPTGAYYYQERTSLPSFYKIGLKVRSLVSTANVPGPAVVVVPSSRKIETLKTRSNQPDMQHLNVWFREIVVNYASASLPENWEQSYFSEFDDYYRRLTTYADHVCDPVFAEYQSRLKVSDEIKKVLDTVSNTLYGTDLSLSSLFSYDTDLGTQESEALEKYVSTNYPLLSRYSYRQDRDAVCEYINALYLTRQQKSATLDSEEGTN